MKYSENWVREWVNLKLSREKLADLLTMSGLEVEEIIPDESDHILDISITPNRGDCLSIKGLGREIALLTEKTLQEPTISAVKATIPDTLKLSVDANVGCPHYVGRIIKNVQLDRPTPAWMQVRLQASGIRSINVIVDVTNYVMLEQGQPMHAFDLAMIDQSIQVRQSKSNESLALLDGSSKNLNDDTMIIADAKKPLAIAGVMGGMDSGVTSLTQDVFLESAYFSPQAVAKQRQFYNLNSDSSYRFERGIDPTIQVLAIERASQLILEIAGGQAGPLIEYQDEKKLPQLQKIKLSRDAIADLLGIDITESEIEKILKRLHFQIAAEGKSAWQVTIPPYRPDITQSCDVIEEIARIYGYDKIPCKELKGSIFANKAVKSAADFSQMRQVMCDLGYHEIITYSFVDKKLQDLLHPQQETLALLNPISSEMAEMRKSLVPSLLTALQYNKSRQQETIRLFEVATCFQVLGKDIVETPKLAAVISGFNTKPQWGRTTRKTDFYDIKGDLGHLLAQLKFKNSLVLEPIALPFLHPGQSARIFYQGTDIGYIGSLHPSLQQNLDIDKTVLLEIDLNLLKNEVKLPFQDISKFPEIRRDLALILKESIPAKDIQDTIRDNAGHWLKDIFIFDVYQGKGITPGFKSLALAVIIQHPTRTLIDEEVNDLMERVIAALRRQFGAELRS